MNFIGIKKEYPNITEDIKKMIREEVDTQLKKKKLKQSRRRKNIRIAVAVMAVIFLTGGTIYALKKAYSVNVEDKGEYAEEVVIEDNSDEEYIIPTLTFEGTYVGEGMTFYDVGTSKISYTGEDSIKDGISICFSSIAQGEDVTSLIKSVEAYEQIDIGDNTGYVFDKATYNDEGVQYEIIVVYDELHYIMHMFVFEDIELEEAIKVACGIKLTPTDNPNAENIVVEVGEYFYSEETHAPIPPMDDYLSTYTDSYTTSVAKDELEIYQMNEPFVTPLGSIDTRNIQVEVNAQVCDDLSLLNKEVVDTSYTGLYDFLGDDGKIHNAVVDYVVKGDGINTVDEAVYSEKVPVKLVYVEVEYTNISDRVVDGAAYYSSIHFIEEKEDTYEVYTGLEEKCTVGYNFIDTRISHFLHSSCVYWYNGRDIYEKNHLVDLKPGESQTVQWAYLVAEDMLPYMYFDFKADCVTFYNSKYVDIRQ